MLTGVSHRKQYTFHHAPSHPTSNQNQCTTNLHTMYHAPFNNQLHIYAVHILKGQIYMLDFKLFIYSVMLQSSKYTAMVEHMYFGNTAKTLGLL